MNFSRAVSDPRIPIADRTYMRFPRKGLATPESRASKNWIKADEVGSNYV